MHIGTTHCTIHNTIITTINLRSGKSEVQRGSAESQVSGLRKPEQIACPNRKTSIKADIPNTGVVETSQPSLSRGRLLRRVTSTSAVSRAHDGFMELEQVMIDLAARGLTLPQISARTGLPEAVCYQRMTTALESDSSAYSTVQLRQLQVRRLEHVINALWDQVMEGDFQSQGRAAKNLTDAIREISELLDLKKDRLRDEQVRLTQAQTMLVVAAIEQVRVKTLADVLEALPEAHHETVKAMWDKSFAGHMAQSLEDQAEARVRMGSGAGELALLPAGAEGDPA